VHANIVDQWPQPSVASDPPSLEAALNPAVRLGGQNGAVHNEAAEPEIRTLSSSVVYSDNWAQLRRDEIQRSDGSTGTYAVMERDNFALIIPAENGGFHLVEEYRHPLGRRGWSFPQGSFPKGEDGTSEELARTELAQETGLRAGRLTRLGALAVAHGMSSQYGEHWLATELTQGEPDLEPEELGLRCEWVARAEFEAMARDTRIVDTSTLAGYALLLMAERRGEVDLT
jgi:8-oxo-dGTP pyrophosphatase MutT (NUDIX family)